MTENSMKGASATELGARRGDETSLPASAGNAEGTAAEREARLLVVVRGATRDLGALLSGSTDG